MPNSFIIFRSITFDFILQNMQVSEKTLRFEIDTLLRESSRINIMCLDVFGVIISIKNYYNSMMNVYDP